MASESRITLSSLPLFVRLFGLSFALIGAAVMVAMLTGHGGTVTVGDGPSRPAEPGDAWMPGIFVLIGLAIAASRYHVELDAATRTRIKTYGWAWIVRRAETPLGEVSQVMIAEPEERGTGSGRYTAIPVVAVSPGVRTELAEPRSEVAARKLAQRIAEALRVPVGSYAEPSAAALADTLDRPLAEVARVGAEAVLPPADTSVTISEQVRGIAIVVPRPPKALSLLLFGGLAQFLSVAAFWYFFWRPGLVEPASKQPLVFLFMMAPLAMGIIPVIVMLIGGYRTGAFGGVITVDSEDGLRAWGRRVRPDELRSLTLSTGLSISIGLKVVTDRREFVIARGQRPEDLRWIRALILKQLGARG